MIRFHLLDYGLELFKIDLKRKNKKSKEGKIMGPKLFKINFKH